MRSVYIVMSRAMADGAPGSPLMAFEAYEDAWMLASNVGGDPDGRIVSVPLAECGKEAVPCEKS